ncbi:MAG: amidophosphoribosyltransferase [Gammaproteobacteria bacterium]|jgi:amidophosphoribosyltransferase|nr:amidophosphoribosyltransferase [Gammaproteobacteria bacterium]|tara:strand:- start:1371 stop:2852 length:1482 start_codon:yes stop_codon:yes gene_type:complete
MCGVVGVVSQKEVSPLIYDALTILQHRGQDAAGIATSTNNRFFIRKQLGLVRDVVRNQHILNLRGQMGIGHVRYPTAGSEDRELAQPMYVNSPFGISISHNGNLTNHEELKEVLVHKDLRHLNTDSDSEVLLNVFAHELQKQGSVKPGAKEIFAAVRALHKRVRGAYSVVIMINGVGIVGFRDPFGIRPLIVGSKDSDLIGKDYMIASESTVLDSLGFETLDDVKAGSAVFISPEGIIETESCINNPVPTPCIFEYVYLARPDAKIDKISVHKSRLRMGEFLAKKIIEEKPNHDIDVVIPIPDSSTTSALQLATTLGVKYREGFVKNRYIGRTFIMPFQEKREKSVRQKLNPIDLEFKDKVVLLVDDSIVRGTTSRQIIEMARASGAKKVYFASAAPPIRHQNVYGIDMAATTELVAHQRSEKEIEEFIKADWLIYQNLDDLIMAAQTGNEEIKQFECSIFDGKYVTDDIDDTYLKNLEELRNDKSKASRQVN